MIGRLKALASAGVALAVMLTLLVGPAPQALATTYYFGSEPLQNVVSAAQANARTSCQAGRTGLTWQKLEALMLAPTFYETGAGSLAAPSPLTMSRGYKDNKGVVYDAQYVVWGYGWDKYGKHTDAASEQNAYKRAQWHTGLGVWQLDSGNDGRGLGSGIEAPYAISTHASAPVVARTMMSRYCAATGSDHDRRAVAWGPWVKCGGGQCDAWYLAHYNGSVIGVNTDPTVNAWGGMQKYYCKDPGFDTFVCWYINAYAAKGYGHSRFPNAFWSSNADGCWRELPSRCYMQPLAFSFYDFDLENADHNHYEYRYWMRNDTTYTTRAPFAKVIPGQSTHTTTYWNGFAGGWLCDTSRTRGMYC